MRLERPSAPRWPPFGPTDHLRASPIRKAQEAWASRRLEAGGTRKESQPRASTCRHRSILASGHPPCDLTFSCSATCHVFLWRSCPFRCELREPTLRIPHRQFHCLPRPGIHPRFRRSENGQYITISRTDPFTLYGRGDTTGAPRLTASTPFSERVRALSLAHPTCLPEPWRRQGPSPAPTR